MSTRSIPSSVSSSSTASAKPKGDTIKDNLFLREIRSDGLVLEFRGQRFFFPRPGR